MIQLLNIDAVKASTYNPRKADPKRHDYIELSLRKLGFVLPIYADASGEILSGHQRHYVAKRMGCTKIPVEIVKAMPLEKRKSYNIVFNRATNDLKKNDTSKTVTEKLQSVDVEEIASRIPDIEIDTPEFYPCMNTQTVDVKILANKNAEKMHDYARALAGSLNRIGVEMPVVLDEENNVMNGIGRVQYAVEAGKKTMKAVILPKDKAIFSDLMLNYLSMDFDIHTRYADTLRYNSFMRTRNTRGGGLGDGFYKGIYPNGKGLDFSPLTGKPLEAWKARYGTSVVDFGAGKLYNTRILRDAGIEVAAFEPYFIAVGEDISKKKSLEIDREFLRVVASGKEFDTIFISSVFNSVPFMQDRKYIATICAALCSPNTQLVCWAQGTNVSQNMNAKGRTVLNKTGKSSITFSLDYEPNIVLGDFSKLPKVQKFHSKSEFIEIFSPCFSKIKRLDVICAFLYMEATGAKVDKEELKKAIEFEFDLPYPDGTRMGLVDEAKAAFGKRLGIDLT